MSNRVIYFGTQELFWQCRHGTQRESGTGIDARRPVGRDKYRSHPADYATEDLVECWHTTVCKYAWRELSRQQDRLPAIAAIARRLEAFRPCDRYLAGLWESSLANDLMWMTFDETDQLDSSRDEAIKKRILEATTSPLGIPTWSWASTHSAVIYSENDESIDIAEILHIDYSIIGPTVSGNIKKAFLTVRAPIFALDGMREASSVHIDHSSAIQPLQSKAACKLVTRHICWDNYGFADSIPGNLDCCALFVTKTKPYWWQPAIVVKQVGQTGRYLRLGAIWIYCAGLYKVERIYERIPKDQRYNRDDILQAKKEYESIFAEKLRDAVQTITLIQLGFFLDATNFPSTVYRSRDKINRSCVSDSFVCTKNRGLESTSQVFLYTISSQVSSSSSNSSNVTETNVTSSDVLLSPCCVDS